MCVVRACVCIYARGACLLKECLMLPLELAAPQIPNSSGRAVLATPRPHLPFVSTSSAPHSHSPRPVGTPSRAAAVVCLCSMSLARVNVATCNACMHAHASSAVWRSSSTFYRSADPLSHSIFGPRLHQRFVARYSTLDTTEASGMVREKSACEPSAFSRFLGTVTGAAQQMFRVR